MGDITEVTGIVLSSMAVGEYDRRVVLLTRELGRISAFARGARKPNSQLTGATRPFAFGQFGLYAGRDSYTIRSAQISEYFQELTTELDNVYYGCYFAELSEYYSREGLDATDMINLLYASLKALTRNRLPRELVRYIYELKLMVINGECPDLFVCQSCGRDVTRGAYSSAMQGMYCSNCEGFALGEIGVEESTLYALQYIVTAPIGRLYTFMLSDECMEQLRAVVTAIRKSVIDKEMKSECMLNI